MKPFSSCGQVDDALSATEEDAIGRFRSAAIRYRAALVRWVQ